MGKILGSAGLKRTTLWPGNIAPMLGGGSGMEKIVRPFIDVLSYATPREIPPVIVLPVAFIEWGGPSNFTIEDDGNNFEELASNGRSFNTADPPDDEVPNDRYTEMGRDVTEVRIENPDDPDQFVIVERVDSIQFQGKGRTLELILRNRN